jgi:integral membrane protein (TIGR01906 family)
LAAALTIVLTGPLLLFNPWLVSAEQARHSVAASLGTDQPAVDRVTDAMLRDLFLNGDFGASLDGSAPILDASERSHMQDVGGLVRVLAVLEVAALVTLILTGRWLRRERARRGRLLLRAAGGVGAAALVLGAFFALDFDAAFAAFHAVFFKAGTWQFGAESNLIHLFPEQFWFETSLLAGASIVLAALLAAWLARGDLGSTSAAR